MCYFLSRQELHGDGTFELGVSGLLEEYNSHATEFLDDSVVRDGLANHGEFLRRQCGRCNLKHLNLPPYDRLARP